MIADLFDKRHASRKFQLAAAAFLGGVVFFAIRWMTADQWITFTQWVVGLYMAGNVGDEAVQTKREAK